MEHKLKPCPLCASKKDPVRVVSMPMSDTETVHYIACHNPFCGLKTISRSSVYCDGVMGDDGKGAERAIKNRVDYWNNRPIEDELLKACKAALQFITNGLEFGCISMPDCLVDTAKDTPPMLRAAITKAEGGE